jgi:hypothetical protein
MLGCEEEDDLAPPLMKRQLTAMSDVQQQQQVVLHAELTPLDTVELTVLAEEDESLLLPPLMQRQFTAASCLPPKPAPAAGPVNVLMIGSGTCHSTVPASLPLIPNCFSR